MTQTAKPIAIPQLQELATQIVGDGKKPNMFFVCQEGIVIHVSRDLGSAYRCWKEIPRDVESSLEDRKHGTVADNSPVEEGSTKLVVSNDAYRFYGKKFPQVFY